MIPVSAEFKTAIAAATRQTKAKVLFHLVDVDAAEDATVTVTGEAAISRKDQAVNAFTDMAGKLATLEDDYWLLDGSFVLPPETTESSYEAGWWSAALSGGGGTFAVAQAVTLTFTKDHTVIGFSIYFDELTNEYATDFTIVAYDSLNNVLHTETVTGNASTKYTVEHTVEDFRKVIVTITKWKAANRRARITEISLGVIYEYDGDTLIKVDVLEELDPINNESTANESKFTIENADKRFDILNPTGVYPALQKLQKVVPYLGVVKADTNTEYANMGVFYLDEWQSDEGTLTATFTAHDLLGVISQDNYAGDTYAAETLYDIAVEVLGLAGVSSVNYEVDTALQAITTSGTLDKTTYREALQKIAIAGCAVLYCDRSGKIILEQISTTALSETIDFDNMYAAPLIKLDALVNTIYIKSGANTYTYTDPTKPADEQVLSVEIDNALIDSQPKADAVGAWILVELKKRYLYECNWRTDPSLAVGDIVTIEDDFSADKTARLTKNEFSFAGYLTGKTSARGDGT
ncbi:MAG: hypothetical protein WA125_17045 [Desulfosporosinus sp.]